MTASRLFGRLKALQPPASRRTSAADAITPRSYSPEIPEGAARLAEILGATIGSNRFGEHLSLRRWFSDPVGSAPDLAAPEGDLSPDALRLLAPGATNEIADPRQWLFLDTETTGLAGGTGTYPFLVGIAWWDAGGLEVEQFFMRDYSDEHSVLLALAERMTERPVLVTFNGKSFDWPLLETRYRMTRTIKAPAPRSHLDFLHPARNLWRLRIGSVRLMELERHVLGWNRGPDMASELIPQIYFDYLGGGSPEPLVPIFHHNQMDLRGLAALATRTLSLLANPGAEGQSGLELFGVSRICERRGESVRARELYAQSIARELPRETDRAARHSLARLAKREGDLDLARGLWEGMLGNSREGFEAYEQLAIYFEHRAREPYRAAELARKALLELRNAHRLGTIPPAAYRQRRAQFEKRLVRLERKSARSLLDGVESEPARAPVNLIRIEQTGGNSMPESDSAATQTARISETENKTVARISDPYLREQLEKRRDSLKVAISTIPLTDAPTTSAPFHKLLADVDLAIRNMEEGTFGTCDECHGSVEQERLIIDPLARLCLDCLSSDEQRALERDLELASRVQRGLLPQSDVRHRDWRIHYLYRPAGIVSGDYCDLIPGAGEEGKLFFLLGDVTGKGVAASMLMTHLHAMFRALSSIGLELDRLMEMANRMFCESTISGQYATLVCGRAGHSGEIEIASAGHFPVLLNSKDGVTNLEATGLPLGMFSTSSYTVRRVRLEPGDSLLLYTDGISEARDNSGEEYGIAAISRATAGRHGWEPRDLVAACVADVEKHSSGRRPVDDQTVMVIQRGVAANAAFND